MNDTFPTTINDETLAQLKKLVHRKGQTGTFVRIGVKGGGCSGLEYILKLDTVSLDADLVLEFEDLKIACDRKSAKFLEGSELVWTGNLMSGGFQFVNPNAQRSCGCGTSFTPKKS